MMSPHGIRCHTGAVLDKDQPRRGDRFWGAEGTAVRRERAGRGPGCIVGPASRMNFSGRNKLATEMSSSISSQ